MPFSFDVPVQDNAFSKLTSNYPDGGSIDIGINPAVVTPSRCTITYTCDSIVHEGGDPSDIKCSDFDTDLIFDGNSPNGSLTDGQLTVPTNPQTYPNFKPGEYTTTIKACVDGVSAVQDVTCKDIPFVFTLTDPCDPPIQVTFPEKEDIEYVISQGIYALEPEEFVISPDYCPMKVEIIISELPGGQKPITEADAPNHDVEYDADLDIVGETQTITQKIITSSIHSETETVLDESIIFTVTYLSPCEDPNLTIVTPTAQTDPTASSYLDTEHTYNHNPYIVTPSICPLTVTCLQVTGPSDKIECPENPFSGTMTNIWGSTDYFDGTAPGDYHYEFKVSTGGSDPALNPTFLIKQTLEDPCENAPI